MVLSNGGLKVASKIVETNHFIEDWIAARCESENTVKQYIQKINQFKRFSEKKGLNFGTVVKDYREAKYSGPMSEQKFLDKWNDLIASFTSMLKKKYPPLSQRSILTAPKSFFKKWKIPLDVDLPKRAYVTYHNRDLTKPIIRQIISKASQRNRTIYLILAESGLRTGTVVELKYWQIKKDFEAGITPMQILTPSSEIKYHVGDRWSFIGEEAEKALRIYLSPRLPLKDGDYLFQSEKPHFSKGKQFGASSISSNFNTLTRKLKFERGAPYGKPGLYRLHGLRKYFRNNMRVDPSFREFWMGHSLGVDSHYISRNVEDHRKRYAEGYEQLRIQEKSEINKKEMNQLKATNEQLIKQINDLQQNSEAFKEILKVFKDPKKLKQFGKLMELTAPSSE